MYGALVPNVVAHASPSFGPSRNPTCRAKDVPPSRSDEHATLTNVSEHATFGAREKEMIIMEIIVSENIGHVGVMWNVCTQCGDWAS